MDFTWNNQRHWLVGVDVHPIKATSLKQISKAIWSNDTTLALYMQMITQNEPASLPASMQEILSTFVYVFSKASDLPPQQEIDHCINLKESTEPINVRPFLYAHCQKE